MDYAKVIQEMFDAGYVDLAYGIQCLLVNETHFEQALAFEGGEGVTCWHDKIEAAYVEMMYGLRPSFIVNLWENHREQTPVFDTLNSRIIRRMRRYKLEYLPVHPKQHEAYYLEN